MGKVAGPDKEREAKATVFKYLTNQNRPYSVNDLVANLHNEVPKSLMQKILDGLVEETKISEKVNGKQKAYYVNQKDFPVASEADLLKIDQEAVQAQHQLNELNGRIKVKEDKIKNLNSALTTEDAKEKIEKLKLENSRMNEKLDVLTSDSSKMVDQDTMNEAKKQRVDSVKEWRKRKRMFNDMTEAILDGYPHPKKHLYEEVGVETDQDVGVTMPDIS